MDQDNGSHRIDSLSRRRVLKQFSGVGLGALAISGTAVGKDSQNFDDKVQSLLTRRNIEEAKDFAASRGIELSVSTATVSSDSDGISTRNHWSDPDSSPSNVYVAGYSPINGADNRVIAGWNLDEDDTVIEAFHTCPNDAAALFWDSDAYVPVSASSSNFYPSGSRVNYEGINTYNGALAEVNDPRPANDGGQGSWGGSFGIGLDTVSGGGGPFVMEYKHTFIDSAYQTCGGITIGMSLGAGSINYTGNVQGWTATAQFRL